ncbi:MAG: tetraacyldisaccharide 4'-kinase [Rhodopirellula sp. JB044]|uniref:tetraacyldisaccharide 4'-kinase n=1 Tax=Rhodopirellula sp. JB044 TaxID=3342844 RepID=UPI00370C57CB
MNLDHRSLLSGQKNGPVAVSIRASLWAASLLYGAAARVRRAQYDAGRKEICRADVPVISVGNLTTGGTGKTPVVCDLCRRLRDLGRQVAIVSRGYGAGETGVNDEALELAERLPDVPHVQHPDRVEAARIAVDELEADILVMDDGFQHRRLHRDLDLVVVDATCPFGFGHLLPRGYLREPVSSLRRADAVILTRSEQIEESRREAICKEIRSHLGNRPLFETTHAATRVVFEQRPSEPIASLSGRRIALVSAIGNPDAFEQTARECGADVVGHFRLPDHDPYEREAREQLNQWLVELKSSNTPELVLCTHKDAVKIAVDELAGLPLGYLQIDLAYRSGEAELQELLMSLLAT